MSCRFWHFFDPGPLRSPQGRWERLACAHRTGCARCQRRALADAAIGARLRDAAAQPAPSANLPAEVMRRIHANATTAPRWTENTARHYHPRLLWATGVALLALVAGAAIWSMSINRQARRQQALAAAVAPLEIAEICADFTGLSTDDPLDRERKELTGQMVALVDQWSGIPGTPTSE